MKNISPLKYLTLEEKLHFSLKFNYNILSTNEFTIKNEILSF